VSTPTIESLSASIEALTKAMASMAEGVPNAIKEGMTMASVAASRGKPSDAALARAVAKRSGARCTKCHLPVSLCGGPEMVLVQEPKLDEHGKPVMKDGKPVTVEVRKQRFKDREEDANHVLMVVLPPPPADRFFQGIIVSGRTFLSKHQNHQILVPRKNDFKHMLQLKTEVEREFVSGESRGWSWPTLGAHKPDFTRYMRPKAPVRR